MRSGLLSDRATLQDQKEQGIVQVGQIDILCCILNIRGADWTSIQEMRFSPYDSANEPGRQRPVLKSRNISVGGWHVIVNQVRHLHSGQHEPRSIGGSHTPLSVTLVDLARLNFARHTQGPPDGCLLRSIIRTKTYRDKDNNPHTGFVLRRTKESNCGLSKGP